AYDRRRSHRSVAGVVRPPPSATLSMGATLWGRETPVRSRNSLVGVVQPAEDGAGVHAKSSASACGAGQHGELLAQEQVLSDQLAAGPESRAHQVGHEE